MCNVSSRANMMDSFKAFRKPNTKGSYNSIRLMVLQTHVQPAKLAVDLLFLPPPPPKHINLEIVAE